MIEVRNYIRGEWLSIRQGREIEIRNPADQDELVGKGYLASATEAEAALAAASEALPAWSRMPAPKRGEIVERAADLLRAEQDDVARLLTREEGKTVAEAKGEIYRAYNVLNYTAGQSRRMGGITIPSELPKNFAYTIRQPLGVVALITPWNFPVCIPAWKIAPGAGCGKYGCIQAVIHNAAYSGETGGDFRAGGIAARGPESCLSAAVPKWETCSRAIGASAASRLRDLLITARRFTLPARCAA